MYLINNNKIKGNPP